MGDKGSKDKGKKEKQKKAQLNPKEKRKLKKEKMNRHWHSTKDKLQLSTWCNSMKCVCYLPGGIAMAKNQNTFEKQRREMEKKRKAEEKQERRRKKKEQANEPHLLDPPATRDSWPSACRTHMFRYVCLSSRVKRQDTEHSSKSYYRVHLCLCHSRWHVTFFGENLAVYTWKARIAHLSRISCYLWGNAMFLRSKLWARWGDSGTFER